MADGSPTIDALEGAKVCVGPKGSGSSLLAQAVLQQHGVSPAEIVFLPIDDMTQRIHSGELDAGIFVGHVPTEAVKTLVHETRFRLLSIESRRIAGLLGPALSTGRIEAGTYGSQLPGEVAIDTIATRAVLVTTEELIISR